MLVLMMVHVLFQFMVVQIQILLIIMTLFTNDDGTCCYGDILEITVTTDNYPTETSWQLIDDNGTIVQSISNW